MAFLESHSFSPDKLQLDSPLLRTFQQFLLSTFLHAVTKMAFIDTGLECTDLSDYFSISDEVSYLSLPSL